jgi:hypothetical protein
MIKTILNPAGDAEFHFQGQIQLFHLRQIPAAYVEIFRQGFAGQIQHMGTEQRYDPRAAISFISLT